MRVKSASFSLCSAGVDTGNERLLRSSMEPNQSDVMPMWVISVVNMLCCIEESMFAERKSIGEDRTDEDGIKR